MNQNPSYRKLYNIEFIRFVFALCIIYFHLLHSFIMPYTEDSALYQHLADQARYAKYIVECFFLMSGYFLYQSIRKHPGQSTGEFVCRKISRLWAPLACSVILMAVFFGKDLYASFLDLLFLQSSGLATDWQGLNWYVSAFFFVEIFYFMLYKAVRNPARRRLVICLLVYFAYELNINATDGEFGRKMLYGVFNMGIARAVAGIGLGYLTGEFWEYVTMKWQNAHRENKGNSLLVFLVISFLEVVSGTMLVINFFFHKYAYENQFIVVVLFWVFFVCMLTGKGIISRITDHPWMAAGGKYAYSIYVMQEVSFAVMERTWWQNTGFVHQHVILSLVLSILMAAGIGILTCHLIEKPSAGILNRVFSKVV